MPNVENIQKVIEVLMYQPDERVQMDNFWSVKIPNGKIADFKVYRAINLRDFNFAQSQSDCKTAACLAGWVTYLFPDSSREPLKAVEETFEIPRCWAIGLCYRENWYHVKNGSELMVEALSERQILITLLCWLRDGKFEFTSEPRLLDDGIQGTTNAE